MASNIVKYGGWDPEVVTVDQEEASKSGTDMLKLAVGRNVLRFLPPLAGAPPYVKLWQHFINMPGGEAVSFGCPLRMMKERCPACEYARDLDNSGDHREQQRAYDFKSKLRVFANVIDRSDEDAGPKPFAFGKGIFEDLADIRTNADDGFDFSDPKDGADIVITRKGTGKNDTEYKVRVGNRSPLGNMNWIEQQGSLTRFARVMEYDEIVDKLQLDRPRPGQKRERATQQRINAKGAIDVTATYPEDEDDDLPGGYGR